MFSLDVGLHEHRCMPDVTHGDRVVTHEFQDSSSEDVCCIKVFLCFLKSLQGDISMGNGFFHTVNFQDDILTSAIHFLPYSSLMTSAIYSEYCPVIVIRSLSFICIRNLVSLLVLLQLLFLIVYESVDEKYPISSVLLNLSFLISWEFF
jgi:hypothetical protein